MARRGTKKRATKKRRSPSIIRINQITRSRSGPQSSVGFIKLPSILKNDRDIKNMGQNMEKKQIIELFLAITAKWCGACHNIRDRLLKAIGKSRRSATNVDETQLDAVNSQLNANIQAPHYPYFIVIGNDGKIRKILKSIEEVEAFLAQTPSNEGNQSPSRSVTGDPIGSAMPSAMPSALQEESDDPVSPSLSASNASALTQASIVTNESGLPTGIQLPSVSAMNNSARSNSATSNPTSQINSARSNSARSNSTKNNSAKNNSTTSNPRSQTNSAKSNSAKNNSAKNNSGPSNPTSQANSVSASSVSTQKLMSMPPVSGMAETVAKGVSVSNPNVTSTTMTAKRPNSSQDRISPVPASPSTKGGCLYTSLAATAYQLAPPAVLLGIAAATLSKKRRSKKQKQTRRLT